MHILPLSIQMLLLILLSQSDPSFFMGHQTFVKLDDAGRDGNLTKIA